MLIARDNEMEPLRFRSVVFDLRASMGLPADMQSRAPKLESLIRQFGVIGNSYRRSDRTYE